MQEIVDDYEYFGTYRNSDARLLLDALTEKDIRFEIEIDDSAIRNMSPFQMLFGGSFGTGSKIAISIHPEDFKAAETIRNELFKT